MIRSSCRPICCLVAVVLALGEARAQLALPGAAPAATEDAAATPGKRKGAGAQKGAEAKAKGAKPSSPPLISGLAGRPLMLNGNAGLLEISGDDKTATIDKLRLAGESVSDPLQRCVVDIVGEKPIQASDVGRPDGLERFEADVPACPFSFDVLDGAALAPSQITACVFKAADCQTSPGGLWGPDGASLVGDADKIAKERAEAEKAMAKAVRAIEDRARNSAEAAELARDQNSFAGQRDDICRNYVKEAIHGYCAMRVTEARTALLEARISELAAAEGRNAASEKPSKAKPKKGGKEP